MRQAAHRHEEVSQRTYGQSTGSDSVGREVGDDGALIDHRARGEQLGVVRLEPVFERFGHAVEAYEGAHLVHGLVGVDGCAISLIVNDQKGHIRDAPIISFFNGVLEQPIVKIFENLHIFFHHQNSSEMLLKL